ncbi:MAG: selenocysteine-specific translation elongation factor [Candidatus Brocadiae bacterium]|nr:selenocysteine-specific translation elongation factor [Candidatus Brocadiia bacterium]
MDKIFNIVIGTAGHIDHGKSSLVRSLTGIDPDRLKEEKERGLTIDLGFAPLELPDGRLVGIIDVPGHERFIKNMVAGATSIDFVILVVAANDGVMPQTREHLEIMQILGIQKGMVALTKIDTVESDLVFMAQEEIKNVLKGTFLENAPIVGFSNTTGQGLDEFKRILFNEIQKITPSASTGVFRMPIQRIFSKHGYGTVITGIPVSGKIKIGEELEILPGEFIGRVKKIQAYGQEVEEAREGHSTALNVKDLDYKVIERGQVAACPGYFEPVTLLEAKFEYMPDARTTLEYLTPVRFHTGTLEEMGKIAILGKERMEPGETGYVQIRLDRPILAVAGDRFVLRLSSPMLMIGGGVIIGSCGHRLKRFRNNVEEQLQEREKSLVTPESKLEVEIRKHCLLKEGELLKLSQRSKEEFDVMMGNLIKEGSVLSLGGNPLRYIHTQVLEEMQVRFFNKIKEFFKQNPYKIYIKKAFLKNALSLENILMDEIVSRLVAQKFLGEKGENLFLPEREIALKEKEQRLLERIEKRFLQEPFIPPSWEELPQFLSASSKEIAPLFELLCEKESIIEIERGLFFHAKAIEEAKNRIIETIQKQGELVSADFRDQLKTTRKYIIPLLDYFDKIGLTVRKESSRVLKR